MRKLLIVLVVFAALGVGADRVAAHLVASEAERRLAGEGFADPGVQMHGFPFLTQLAARDFDRVTVTGARLEAGDGRARDVRAELTDVRVPPGSQVQIGALSARGTVPYDVVVQATEAPSLRLSAGSGGQVEVARTVDVGGQSFDVVAQARVQARGSRLRLVPTDISIEGGGSLDDQLAALLADRVALTYPVPDLPEGVQVDVVTATKDGFVVRVTGREVSVDPG